MRKLKLKVFFRFLKFVLPYKRQWLGVLILSNALALGSLVNPYLAKLLIDRGISGKDLKSFALIALAAGLTFLLNELLSQFNVFLEHYIKTKVHFDLTKKLFRHRHKLSLRWFKERGSGEHIYTTDYDIDLVTGLITDTFPRALSIITKLLFTLVIIFTLNYKIAIVSLILAPFLYLPGYLGRKRLQGVYEVYLKNSEDIYNLLTEIFSRIELIKVFGKEISSLRKYLSRVIINIRINIRHRNLEAIISSVSRIISKAAVGAIGFYGGYQVIKGNISLGALTAITVYLYQLIELQEESINFIDTTIQGLSSCRRIADILDERPEIIDSPSARPLIIHKPQIIFKDVSFGYRAKEPVLENINFTINGPAHLAIAGPSGSGKTTTLNLLVRLYDPSSGAISIDGDDLKELKLGSLRRQIGFVAQEPFLWNDTIANNIKYSRPDAKEELVKEIALLCGVADFSEKFPDGYNTVVGENACKLSEGQKQKIAIARALIKEPKILIFDEAMAAMDSAAEEKIIANIHRNFKDITLITVSHRLSTVMSADYVYYLSAAGRIIMDKPDNLLRDNPGFKLLFGEQSKR